MGVYFLSDGAASYYRANWNCQQHHHASADAGACSHARAYARSHARAYACAYARAYARADSSPSAATIPKHFKRIDDG